MWAPVGLPENCWPTGVVTEPLRDLGIRSGVAGRVITLRFEPIFDVEHAFVVVVRRNQWSGPQMVVLCTVPATQSLVVVASFSSRFEGSGCDLF